MAITGNKGEWSELYVLFKLLGEKKLYAGDGDLNKLKTFYPVLKILRDELARHLEYTINQNLVVISENGEVFVKVGVTDFIKQANVLFANIENVKSAAKGAFEITALNDFLSKIRCQKIKAKSKDKADIHVMIHDYHTCMEPTLGFSIKSDAGSSPTLLNASHATLFVYEIEGGNFNDANAEKINSMCSQRMLQDRVNEIYKMGAKLKFAGVPNSTFENNLRLIDSRLPEIVGWMMADSYLKRDMNIRRTTERIRTENPFGYNLSGGHDHYGYKMKSFMVSSALGMLPGTPWSGKYEATGGYIIVKGDGDIICFHIYDRNLLEDYLFNNTKFETPDSKRYDTAEVYKKGDKYYFNLSLQIRFY